VTSSTQLISLSSYCVQPKYGNATMPSISVDGRYVAFTSNATNLVAQDTGGQEAVFVRDRTTNETTLASVSSSGVPANDESLSPSISATGRYVAFYSAATNLVSGDTNGTSDVFVHDMVTGSTKRVSVTSSGGQANDESNLNAISADGNVIAFRSSATNLDSGGDTNGIPDVFVHTISSGVTKRVSVSTTGTESTGDTYDPAISGDGKYVAFTSFAKLSSTASGADVKVYTANVATGEITFVSHSADGTVPDGPSLQPALSFNGRYVAFSSLASNIVSKAPPTCAPPGSSPLYCGEVYLWDRTPDTTRAVSVSSGGVFGNKSSEEPSISDNGSMVAFESFANNLVSGDSNGVRDVFLHYMSSGVTKRVSLTSSGTQASANSQEAKVDGDGTVVAFSSYADLVANDKNDQDIYVRLL